MENVGKWMKDSLDSYKMSISMITFFKTFVMFFVIYFTDNIELIKHFIIPAFLILDFILYFLCKLHVNYLNERTDLLNKYSAELIGIKYEYDQTWGTKI